MSFEICKYIGEIISNEGNFFMYLFIYFIKREMMSLILHKNRVQILSRKSFAFFRLNLNW